MKLPFFNSSICLFVLMTIMILTDTIVFGENNIHWIGVPENCYGTITASGAVWHLPETDTLEAADWIRPFVHSDQPNQQGNFSVDYPVALPVFRKVLTLPKSKRVQSLVLTVTANASYELYFCGKPVTGLIPSQEPLLRAVQIDLTSRIEEEGPDGPYVLDLLTGYPKDDSRNIDSLKIAAGGSVVYTDGSTDTFDADSDWQVTNGPVLYYQTDENRMSGEIVDGNFWFRTLRFCGYAGTYSFPFSQYVVGQAAAVDAPAGPYQIVSIPAEPEIRQPISLKQIGPNRWLADFGEEISGYCTAVFEDQPAGDLIRIRYAQQLDSNGGLRDTFSESYPLAIHFPDEFYSTDYFLFGASDKPYEYRPHFLSRSFRYVEFSGVVRRDGPKKVSAVIMPSL